MNVLHPTEAPLLVTDILAIHDGASPRTPGEPRWVYSNVDIVCTRTAARPVPDKACASPSVAAAEDNLVARAYRRCAADRGAVCHARSVKPGRCFGSAVICVGAATGNVVRSAKGTASRQGEHRQKV